MSAARIEFDRIIGQTWHREKLWEKIAFMKQANLFAASGAKAIEDLKKEWQALNPIFGSMHLRKHQDEEWQALIEARESKK